MRYSIHRLFRFGSCLFFLVWLCKCWQENIRKNSADIRWGRRYFGVTLLTPVLSERIFYDKVFCRFAMDHFSSVSHNQNCMVSFEIGLTRINDSRFVILKSLRASCDRSNHRALTDCFFYLKRLRKNPLEIFELEVIFFARAAIISFQVLALLLLSFERV